MSDNSFSGACLCGSVRYTASGAPVRFYHCHCGRCRKASGTGHASNIMLKPGKVAWQQGEDLLGRYKVPDAERFATCFCKNCGSPLPREVPELDMVVIPAGSLDTSLSLKPQARIFWDSRADWSCEAGDLPVFGEYPPPAE